MGSLMAGWQTNPQDANQVYKRSISSLTNEEVQRFWKARKSMIENHLQDAQRDANLSRSISVPVSPRSEAGSESGGSYSGSMESSPPVTPTTPTSSSMTDSSSSGTPGWWKRSTWAFLNEPPIVEEKQMRYVAQFDVRGIKEAASDAPTNSSMYAHTRSS